MASVHTRVRGHLNPTQQDYTESPGRLYDPGKLSPQSPSESDPYHPSNELSPLDPSEPIELQGMI
jgi:hypothetical protein